MLCIHAAASPVVQPPSPEVAVARALLPDAVVNGVVSAPAPPMAIRVWEDGQPVWGEVSPGGWVAGTVVHIGGSTAWTVEWHHAHRFIGPEGYADPRAELEEHPFSYRYDRLVERLFGEADMFSGTPSFMEQLVVLHQLAVPKHKHYKLGANLIKVLLRYFQPLPGLQMAETHYRAHGDE